jgi:hypothetical protein
MPWPAGRCAARRTTFGISGPCRADRGMMSVRDRATSLLHMHV